VVKERQMRVYEFASSEMMMISIGRQHRLKPRAWVSLSLTTQRPPSWACRLVAPHRRPSLSVDRVGYRGYSRSGGTRRRAGCGSRSWPPNRPWARHAHCNAAIASPQYATDFVAIARYRRRARRAQRRLAQVRHECL